MKSRSTSPARSGAPSTGFAQNGYTATVSADYRNFAVQWVEVDLSLTHTRLGDLKIHLISPDGTDSVLLDRPAGGTNNTNSLSFTFSTNHAWGESPDGTWKLYVEDFGTTGGSLESWTLHLHGDDQTADTTYYYTNDFATLAGDRSTLSDASGDDTINAAAVTGAPVYRSGAGRDVDDRRPQRDHQRRYGDRKRLWRRRQRHDPRERGRQHALRRARRRHPLGRRGRRSAAWRLRA